MPPNRKLVNELRISSPTLSYKINLNDSTGDKYSASALPGGLPFHVIKPNDKISFDTILGKRCIVILTTDHEFNSKTWFWQGLVLRQEFMTGDYYYATNIDENYKIKPDEFIVPTYIKIRDLSKLKN